MRIAQLISARLLNGAARLALNLSEALAERGHEVLVMHRPELGSLQAPGVRFAEVGFRRSLGELAGLARRLDDEGVEVIHTHMSSAHATGVLLRLWRGIPAVATAHSRHFQPHWAFNDQVIAPSQSTADYQRRVNFVSSRRLTVIPNFVDARAITQATPEGRAEARRRLGVDADALVIGQVADITANKRPSDLVAAARPLLEARADAVVLLVGADLDAGETARVRLAAEGLGDRVRLLGRRPDIGAILAGFDIFALTSLSEESPMAILEAMTAGLPVAATDVGGVGELAPEGLAALLSPAGDPAALATNLKRLSDDPGLRRRLGEAGRARALADYARDPIVTRIEQVLGAAAAVRPGWAGRRARPH